MEPQDLEMPDFTEYNPEVSTLYSFDGLNIGTPR